MAGGVQEGDELAVALRLISTNVLGNAARFARRHIRLADSIQQGGFAVVYMAEHGDDRRPCLQVFFALLGEDPLPNRLPFIRFFF